MKRDFLTWTIAVLLFGIAIWVWRYNVRLSASADYLSSCFSPLSEAIHESEDKWFKSSKRRLLIEGCRDAQKVSPPPGADKGLVIRVQKYLGELLKLLEGTDDELKLAVDVLVLVAAIYADTELGTGGRLTGIAVEEKFRELGREADRHDNFVEAAEELHRYVAKDLLPFWIR